MGNFVDIHKQLAAGVFDLERNPSFAPGTHSNYWSGREDTHLASARPRSKRLLRLLMVGALLFIALLDIGPLLAIDANANAILTLLAALIFVSIHGYIALGGPNIIAFGLITVAVSFISEAIGVATGVVFGAYHYTDLLGPKLLGVPPMIQIGYLATGYASALSNGRSSLPRPLSSRAIIAASVAGAFIMVSWDVAMDPYQSTVTGDSDPGTTAGAILASRYTTMPAGSAPFSSSCSCISHFFASHRAERPQTSLMGDPTVF